jgi:hypothetical protein
MLQKECANKLWQAGEVACFKVHSNICFNGQRKKTESLTWDSQLLGKELNLI